MKQYRITSEHFVHQGETGDTDAVMDPKDLYELKRLAGITGLLEAEAGVYTGQNTVPQTSEEGIQSPVGSNISYTANERRQLESEYNARPGTDLWFIINFTKPFLNGSLRDHVERYLEEHPEYRQKNLPGAV
jgi:hypothetical protein